MDVIGLSERVRIEEHFGKKVIRVDYSRLKKPDEIFAVIQIAGEIIQHAPPKSLLSLIDVTDIYFDTEVVNRLRDAAKENEPHIRASAIVGITGLKRAILPVIAAFSKREFKVFDTIEAALRYLVSKSY